jgi:hypothetical protein
MARPAKILLAGILVAILPCGTATSQTLDSSVLNDQVQLGDVFSQQTLNVVDVSDFTDGASSATANSMTASGDGNNVDVRSNQTADSAVAAGMRLDVTGHAGTVVSLGTNATGNTAFANAYASTVTGVFNQTTGPAAITGNSHIEAPQGSAGSIDSQIQAVGNAHATAIEFGSAGVRVNQANAATVTTDGGGVYGYVSDTASFTATSSANDVTLTGQGGSAARIITDQSNVAGLTQASQFTAFGNAQTAVTTATAAGNNLNAQNEGYLLDVTASQSGNAYVRAQSESAAYQFGTGTAAAYGVGNAISAGDVGGEIMIDTTQINDGGGIESIASFNGQEGYDANASATAIGNSVTGFACADCEGRMTVSNSQVSNADIGARSIVNVAGSGRSVSGVSQAIGNTATYYVSRPSGQ